MKPPPSFCGASNVDPQWQAYAQIFLTNKVKGERLVLISTLTGASLWPLFLEALHLSHADLSSLVPFFGSSDIETSLRSAVAISHAHRRRGTYFKCTQI